MAGVTVFVSTDIALQGADLVSGGQVANVKKGVELLLLNNVYKPDGPSVPGRGLCDVSVLLRQGLDFLSKSPHDTLGVAVGCKTPEIRKAYKRQALKYHPDKNPLTTPLFQLMSAAHDKLLDPTQRQKEERTAAAKNPKPKPAPPPQAPVPPPGGFPAQNNSANPNANPNVRPNGNPAQPRQTYDPKTGKWSGDAEWEKYQQQPSGTDQSAKAQEAARRKQYYDEILREQFKKAESDRKAKEYAAMREAATRQRAAAAGAAGAGANGVPPTGAAAAGGPGAAGTAAGAQNKPPESATNPNTNYYNYNYQNPRKASADGSTSNGTAYGGGAPTGSAGAGAGASNPNYYNRPPPPTDNAAAGAGAYAGRQYKPATDSKVHPQNVPLYGKIPSREGPRESTDSKPGTRGASRRGSRTSETGAAEGTTNTTSSGAAGANVPPSTKYNAGIAGTDHGSSSSNLRGGAKPNANRVPRPYGLRCLFVGTNAAELEWVTSKYHRNSLLAELSWRLKEGDMNASWKGTWESASKLISSGKCRKKNLVPGGTYEFRVRAVEELAGGLLGYRSDWSDTITITLMPDKTTNTSNTGAPPLNPSPSHKGLASKPSYYARHNLNGKEGGAFPFPNPSDATSEGAGSKPGSQPSQPQPQPQPQQPAQPKNVHTFERFTSNHKASEPKTGVQDQYNTEAKEKVTSPTPNDGRKSTSSLPPKSNIYDTFNADKAGDSSGAKNKAQAGGKDESPLHEMTKINLDNVKRYPHQGLSGSGRNVWGPDSSTPEGARANTAAAKKAAEDKKATAAAANKAAAAKKAGQSAAKSGHDSDGEVEEDIQDGTSSVDAREVDDEVTTVGVDEDSSSVHTSATKANAKPTVTAGPQKASHESKSRGATAQKDTKRASAGNKGEFEDFTIEVEDGSDDEEDESDIEDEDDFAVEYEEMYTLVAPPSKVKATKKTSSSDLGMYSHPVRAEPVPKSTIVGYLVLGTDVVACADAGNWLKVRIHKQPTRKNSMRSAEDIVEWGWSLRSDKAHEYLVPNKTSLPPLHHPHVSKTHESPAPKGSGQAGAGFKSPNANSGSYYAPSTPLSDKTPSTMGNPLGNRSMRALPKYPNHHQQQAAAGEGRRSFNEKDVPVWMELFDVGGHAYYFNEATGESKWEPPEWVEEQDPASGAKYYVNLGSASADPTAPLYSTWTKPAEFARLLRT